MLGQPGPAADRSGLDFDRAVRRTRRAAVVVGTVWVLTAVILFAPLPDTAQRIVSGVVIVAACLGLAGACFVRYREGSGRRQIAWMLWTIAGLAGAFANAWEAATYGWGLPGRLTPNDLAIGLALTFVVTGFGFFVSTTRTGLGVVRMVLDGLVLGGSVILIAQDLLQPGLFLRIQAPVANPLGLVTPVIDLVIATIAGLQYLRVGRDERPAMGFASLGFAGFAVSDLIVAVSRAQGSFELGSPVDLGTIAGFLLLGLGVAWPVGPLVPRTADEPYRSHIRGTVITFGVFVVAAVVHLAFGRTVGAGPVSNGLVVMILLAVAARQVLLIVDNERLRAGLEKRVRDRNIELREVTQRTDLLVDSVGDGVYGVNADGIVTFVNPAAARVLGYRPRELMGRSAHDVFHSRELATQHVLPPAGPAGTSGRVDATDDPDLAGSEHRVEDCYITRVIAQGEAVTAIEDTYRAMDGRRFPVEVTASPLAPTVRARGAVVVFRDVTQRREVDRLKDQFVSMVSHELKTPLTAIRGSLGLLAGGALGSLAPPATRMVEIAMDSSERLTRMINQILDLERIESGVLPIERGRYRAADLVADTLEQVEVLAAEHQIKVVPVSVDGVVSADRDQTLQTLLNLIGNAIKFSPAGAEVAVGAALTGEFVEFWVSDSGRGIPPDQLERVFARFHQVDSSDARDKGGTGLGLAISKSLVERLGGRIWAENGANGGATFRFTLPAAPPETGDRTSDKPEPAPRRAAVTLRGEEFFRVE